MTSRYFAAFCLRQPDLLPSRFGLTVPRAVGKAVLRNRIKRRMRAAVRASFHTLPDAWAIVFNPRRSVAEASFKDLCREVDRIFSPMRQVLILCLRGYKLCVSPLLPSACRFYPTCSEYMMEAIALHGAWLGVWMGIRRLLRCHPFHKGGYDPVHPLADDGSSNP